MSQILKLDSKKFYTFLSSAPIDKNYNHIEDAIAIGCNLIDVNNIYKTGTERLKQGILNGVTYYDEFDLYSGDLFKKISDQINVNCIYEIEIRNVDNVIDDGFDHEYLSTCVHLSNLLTNYSFLYYYEIKVESWDGNYYKNIKFSLDRFKNQNIANLSDIAKRVKINKDEYNINDENIRINEDYKKMIKF